MPNPLLNIRPEDLEQLQQRVLLVAPSPVPRAPLPTETPILPPPVQPEPLPVSTMVPVGLAPRIYAPRPPQDVSTVAEGLGLPTQVSPVALPTHQLGQGPLAKLIGKLSPQLQSGITGALGTVASMQPPPLISGPGFAISNIAAGLRGMQERALETGLSLDKFARERARDIYGIQQEAAEAEYAPERAYTQIEAVRQGLALKARELEIESQKVPDFRLVFSQFTGQPIVINTRTGETHEVPDAQVVQTQMLQGMSEFENVLKAAIPAIAQQTPSPVLRTGLAALLGRVEYASTLPGIKRMKELDSIVNSLDRYAKESPEIGLAMQRLNLAGQYFNLKRMGTLFQAGQLSNFLSTFNAVKAGLNIIDEIEGIVQKEFLGKKIPEKRVTFTPEERAAIMDVVQKSGPPQDANVTTWSQAIAGSVQGLLNHILQKKGIPIGTKGYAELLARIPQLAAQLAFIHTQGRGSVALATEYIGLLEQFIASPSVIPAALREYKQYMLQKLQEGYETAVIGTGVFQNVEDIGGYLPLAVGQAGIPLSPFAVRPQAPRLVPQPAAAEGTPTAEATAPKALAPTPKKREDKLKGFFNKIGVGR